MARRLFRYFGWLVGILTLVVACLAVFLLTDPGRQSIISALSRIQPDSGLTIRAERLTGSIYDDFVIEGLELGDPDGTFLRIPRAEIVWFPTRLFLADEIRIERLAAEDAILLRPPKLRDGGGGDPLGGYRLRLGELRVARLEVAEGIVGPRRVFRLEGRADSNEDGTDVAFSARDLSGGDHLEFSLLADEAKDRFELSGRLHAPANGAFVPLLGVKTPIAARIDGEGSWSRWSGTLAASDPDAEAALANLRLLFREGRFDLHGNVYPNLMFGGLTERLAPRGLTLTGNLSSGEDDAPFVLRAANENLAVNSRGRVDADRRQLSDGRITVALKQPRSLIRTLTGEDMTLRFDLSGPILAPSGTYSFAADWFALGDQRILRPRASGRVGPDVPGSDFTMRARFDRLLGAGELVEQLSTGASFTAPLRLDGLMVSTDALALQTELGRAVGNVRLDLRTGRYDATTSVNVQAYEIPRFASVAVEGDLHLRPDPDQPRKLRISGPVQARFNRLDNGLLSFLFGGLPQGRADMVRTPDGRVTFSGAQVAGPDMTLSGSGTYSLGQQIDFAASGTQSLFGPADVALTGDITRPAADVSIREYTLALPIRGIRAAFLPDAEGYDFTARGESALGPVSARGEIDLRQSVAVYRFNGISLAGVNASGTLRPAGGVPVEGQLLLSGDGVGGAATFTPEGDNQRIRIGAAFESARLATPVPLRLGTGGGEANILVARDGTTSQGKFGLAGARVGEILANDLAGEFSYAGGAGRLNVSANGRRGRAYDVEAELGFSEGRYTVDASGRYGREAFALIDPAMITTTASGYDLSPTTLRLGEGRARIAARTGASPMIDVSLDEVSLAPLSLLLPTLSFSGTSTGRIMYEGSADRTDVGALNLDVRDFARASGAQVRPSDIQLTGRLQGDLAALRGIIRTNGADSGEVNVRLSGLDIPRKGLADAVLEAGFNGRLDYRGDAGPIWSFTGVEAVDIAGPLTASVDMGGLVADPVLTGRVNGEGLRFESVASGTTIENVAFEGRFLGSDLIIDEFSGGGAGRGRVSGDARVGLSFSRGFPIRANIRADNTALIDIDTLSARVSGDLAIASSTREGGRISGDLAVDRAAYRPGNAQLQPIPELAVREVNREFARAAGPSTSGNAWQLDVRARGADQVIVQGNGLDSDWAVDFEILGEATEPQLVGKATLVRGDYDFAGRRFELTRGEINFQGQYPPDPSLDIDAQARVEGLTATIRIRGLASAPEISLTSIPALPQDEILSRVLFGASISELSAPEAVQLAGAVAALQQGGGTPLDPVGAIRDAVGIDRLRLSGGNGDGTGAGVAAGEYLGSRTYVEVATDTDGNAASQIEHALTRSLSILGRVSSFRGSSVGVRISHDY